MKSGFPLEIEITSVLTKQFAAMDADISTNAYYLDKDEGKGRELDLKVSIPIEPQEMRIPMLFLNLLIQSKNIPGNVWVFFKSPYKVQPTCNCASVLDALKWTPREHYSFTWLKGLHLYSVPITTGNDEFILNKKASNNKDDNLFEAIISLAKATSYEYETTISSFKKLLRTEELLDLDYIEIFYAATVFNGKMYIVDIGEKAQQIQLTPVNHVGAYIDYVSGSYDIKMVIDVVHRTVFEEFVGMIIKDIELLKNAANGDAGTKFEKELLKARKEHIRKNSRISVK